MDIYSLREKFKQAFPTVQEHLALPSVEEEFGPPRAFRLEGHLELRESPPVPRFWFLSPNETELIQIQQDRFIHNWRKVGDGDKYPRYEHSIQTFEHDFLLFREFVHERGIGPVLPNQCEVTYINNIESGIGWDRHGQVGELLTVWQPKHSDAFLPEPEAVGLNWAYVIPSPSGEPLGRLRVTLEPALHIGTFTPTYRLTLTARGRPPAPDIAGIRLFLDLGREWVVRGFASITTSKMHKLWERRDER